MAKASKNKTRMREESKGAFRVAKEEEEASIGGCPENNNPVHKTVDEDKTPQEKGGSNKSSTVTGKSIINSGDAESSDEDDLLEAAAAWAEGDDDDKQMKNLKVHQSNTKKPPQNKSKQSKDKLSTLNDNTATAASSLLSETSPDRMWSLHITQLDFDTTEFDLRQHFVTRGCALSSIRLVCDRGLNGKKLFRGVAFVDVLDEESYKTALALDKSDMLGRRINVRPTKTKSELADIVQRTKEIVKEKIKLNLEEMDEREASEKSHTSPNTDKKRSRKDKQRDGKERKPKRRKTEMLRSTDGNTKGNAKTEAVVPKDAKQATRGVKNQSPTGSKTIGNIDPNRKLSKKERNRKAAILIQMRRRR
jgi:hypothetical protein